MSKKKRREIPHYQLPIAETHFHLDYLKEGSAEEILQAARAIGVERFMTISVQPDNMPVALQLAEQHDDVYATIGVHPHEAASYDDSTTAYLRTHAIHDKVVAIGEIGLDYYYDHCDREVQRRVLCQQLEIAIESALPVVIHTREADDDMHAILREYAPQMPRKGVVHSFTSGMALAQTAVELGFCLGINGIVTFNKADNVREVVAATPLSHLLLETDAPYLTPVPYRGAENAPRFLPFIAERIAEVKGVSVDEVLKQTWHNSLQTFFPDEITGSA
jgi:TatD DNase family protein